MVPLLDDRDEARNEMDENVRGRHPRENRRPHLPEALKQPLAFVVQRDRRRSHLHVVLAQGQDVPSRHRRRHIQRRPSRRRSALDSRSHGSLCSRLLPPKTNRRSRTLAVLSIDNRRRFLLAKIS